MKKSICIALRGRNTIQQIQIKLRWALFVTYTIIQSIMRSEMCSLHLTHPSGAVGSQHCSARGAVGGSVPCSRVSPQSWTLLARAGIQTHNLGLPRVSSPTLYPLGHDCPKLISAELVSNKHIIATPLSMWQTLNVSNISYKSLSLIAYIANPVGAWGSIIHRNGRVLTLVDNNTQMPV